MDELIRPDRYPRSSRYDPGRLLDLGMGPHPLWLLEDLAAELDLRPGMRVLDLGSGRGATPVFLAREYGVRAVAADRWVPAEEAAAVLAEAGAADRVEAVRAEAHTLPFEPGSFDAIVGVDAFECFGIGDHYLPHLVSFLRPGGTVTKLVTVTCARMQEDGRRDWLLRTRAPAAHRPDEAAAQRPVLDMLTADQGELLGFALVAARKT